MKLLEFLKCSKFIPDELGLSRHCGFGEWGLLWSSPKKSNFWQTSWSRIMRKLGLKIQFQASITRRHFTQGSSSWLFLPMPQELVTLLKVVYICSGRFQLSVGSFELSPAGKSCINWGLKFNFKIASHAGTSFNQGSSSWLFLPMPQKLVALLKVVYICFVVTWVMST